MTVLINGESGTGKEYIARLIHSMSNRKDGPFVAVDCGAIPKDLAASEFFGHIKGSFTGAVTDKQGYFVTASGGTIFLDEIGNLPYDVQVQLLRALEERKVHPVGGNVDIPFDVRIISATNENLKEAVASGRFREDLYHRLNEFSIQALPLRERKEDILIFANHFLDKANEELGKQVAGFDEEVMRMRQLLKTKLVDMDLSVRALNCLKAADVETLGDLVQFNKTDLLKFRNFGKKSLTELDDLLESLNLSFGTDISKYKLDKE